MKKLSIGIFAIIMAVGALAFTKANAPKPKVLTNYYWFQVDGSGNPIPITPPAMPPYEDESLNPFGCANQVAPACAKGYNGVTTNGAGQYIPSGSSQLTLLKAD
jgi:hypothetical protein